MKAMRILMMAALTVFLGTTFTSCLNSDDSRVPEFQYCPITIDAIDTYISSVVTDNGIRLNVSNPSAMVLKYTDGTTFVPPRAIAFFYLAEGETIAEGKTQYNVEFASDWGYYYTSQKLRDDINNEPLETNTTVYVNLLNFGNCYIDTYMVTLGYADEWSNEDLKLCITGVEDDVLKMKVMNSAEIEDNDSKAKVAYAALSFRAPRRDDIKAQFPELKLFGADNDSVYLKLENKTSESKEIQKIKIKLN